MNRSVNSLKWEELTWKSEKAMLRVIFFLSAGCAKYNNLFFTLGHLGQHVPDNWTTTNFTNVTHPWIRKIYLPLSEICHSVVVLITSCCSSLSSMLSSIQCTGVTFWRMSKWWRSLQTILCWTARKLAVLVYNQEHIVMQPCGCELLLILLSDEYGKNIYQFSSGVLYIRGFLALL